MIKLISKKVACFLCKDEKSKENYELYEYALYIVLSSVFHTASIICTGLIFGLIIESISFYFSFIIIRKFAGGFHAKTPFRCYFFSMISNLIVLGCIKLSTSYSSYHNIVLLFCLGLLCIVIICLLSPLDTCNNPLNDHEKTVYKRYSITFSVAIFVASCVLMQFALNIGISMLFGIYISAIVLILGILLK